MKLRDKLLEFNMHTQLLSRLVNGRQLNTPHSLSLLIPFSFMFSV
jgi:hypothetical protein